MISIIIPVLNEEERIGRLIRELESSGTGLIGEIIVVDGGSGDGTVDAAAQAGARVILSARRGRGSQMNAGAEAARSETLYFLHADTSPPASFDRKIIESVEGGLQAGCFRLRFDDPHPLLRFYSWFTRFDVDLFRFGDQSLFINRALFLRLGGFDERLTLMEDQEMVKRVKRLERFAILEDEVVTSARKYRENGVLRLQAVFTLLLVFYYAGVPQWRLVEYYRRWIR
ncbi:MAG: TIGR04283 family arsenosugar biosynthesis glycosyltransferase [Balneolaceae bacterium]